MIRLRHFLCAGFVFAFAAIVSTQQIATAKDPFPDVDNDHKHSDAINFLYDFDVVEGDGQTGDYLPGNLINRAEFTAMLIRTLVGEPKKDIYSNCFPDVSEEWFSRYACFAKEEGIVEGFKGGDLDGMFGPDRPLLYGELLVILARVSNWNTSFGGEWYEPSYFYAEQRNILKNKLFNEPANRGTVADIMFRTMALNTLQIGVYDDEETTDDFLDYVDDEPFEIADALRGSQLPANRREEVFVTDNDFIFTFKEIPAGDVVADGEDYFEVYFDVDDPEKDESLELSIYHDRELDVYLADRSHLEFSDGSAHPNRLEYDYLGNGHYKVNVSTTVSGIRQLVIRDIVTGDVVLKDLDYVPSKPTRFEFLTTMGPGGMSQDLRKVEYKVAVLDDNWNPISNAVFSGSSTNGEVIFQHNNDGTATAYAWAKQYGLADIELMATASGQTFTITDQVEFLPVGLGNAEGYQHNENSTITVPLLLNAQIDDIMKLTVHVSIPNSLDFIDVTDEFGGISVVETVEDDLGNVMLTIEGSDIGEDYIEYGVEPGFYSFNDPILNIVLGSPYPQEHYLEVDITAIMMNEELADDAVDGEGGSLEVQGKKVMTDGFIPFATITGKDSRSVCVQALVSPNVDLTDEEIEDIAGRVTEIFDTNVENGSCPYHMSADVTTIYRFFEDDWQDLFGLETIGELHDVSPEIVSDWILKSKQRQENRENDIDPGEGVGPIPVEADEWCTKVFFVPSTTDPGMTAFVNLELEEEDSYGVPSYIVIDSERFDYENNFVHELLHEVSQGVITDATMGAKEGAGWFGNLMNFDRFNQKGVLIEERTGETLTQNQCEKIDWDQERFNVYPPAQPSSL